MYDQLMKAIPTDQLAKAVGEDEATTRQAVETALPALLAGLTANAQTPEGTSSLLGALSKHDDGLADDVSLDRVDTTDGEKIVGHVFGGNTDAVVNQLGGLSGAQTSSLVRKLLPILAPIVMSYLAKQMGGAGRSDAGTGAGGTGAGGTGAGGTGAGGTGGQLFPDAQSAPQGQASPQGGADMGSILQDVLGSALGGATGQRSTGGGGSILTDVLGGILGGRR
ncbi:MULTISPECIES: DUF937 domain-containing protein [unclassified Ornithinimicrobium]|uniref:DUF937 domain-containing protein n=1 Tax=unclassified Ornithinimicrobium TaxID=2615080 RepID=UPI003854AF23